MFDRKQFRKEIQDRLNFVSNDIRVAFAVRSAMRVLPLLSMKKIDTTVFTILGFNQIPNPNKYAFSFWEVNRFIKISVSKTNSFFSK